MSRNEQIEEAARLVLSHWAEVNAEEKKMPRGLNGFHALRNAVEALTLALAHPAEDVVVTEEPSGDEGSATYCCRNCGFTDVENSFWPSDGSSASHCCPECDSLQIFAVESDR